jgi:hypothetical protein
MYYLGMRPRGFEAPGGANRVVQPRLSAFWRFSGHGRVAKENLLANERLLAVETARMPGSQLQGEYAMRFMVMVKATKDSEAGKMPSEEVLAAMAKFNEEMVKAGVLLDANGLQPSSKGARVRFSAGRLGETTNKRTVIDGPFAETRELVAGYWIIQVKSKAEAIEWIRRCPNPHEEESEIEIRQLFELEDFGPSEAVEHHRRLGDEMAKKK